MKVLQIIIAVGIEKDSEIYPSCILFGAKYHNSLKAFHLTCNLNILHIWKTHV